MKKKNKINWKQYKLVEPSYKIKQKKIIETYQKIMCEFFKSKYWLEDVCNCIFYYHEKENCEWNKRLNEKNI